jgi:AcrR family transcriptional regulator
VLRSVIDGTTIFDVPSEIVAASGTVDRRARKRAARRDHLLDLADDLVERLGVEGVTMAALAEAADYAPASLYTYFPSRSALVAALQERALGRLAEVGATARRAWDTAIAALEPGAPAPVAALARLWAFSDLFLAAPELHPREFRLQQQLLVTTDVEHVGDAASVVPAAMDVLDLPRGLLAGAEQAGALQPAAPAADPLGQPLDGTLTRTLAWVVALNGALLVDGLATGAPVTGAGLGEQLTGTLLLGWGAPTDHLRPARDLSRGWAPEPPSRSSR